MQQRRTPAGNKGEGADDASEVEFVWDDGGRGGCKGKGKRKQPDPPPPPPPGSRSAVPMDNESQERQSC
eukprot:1580993-Pleurochrysis_carterae.AAC.1